MNRPGLWLAVSVDVFDDPEVDAAVDDAGGPPAAWYGLYAWMLVQAKRQQRIGELVLRTADVESLGISPADLDVFLLGLEAGEVIEVLESAPARWRLRFTAWRSWQALSPAEQKRMQRLQRLRPDPVAYWAVNGSVARLGFSRDPVERVQRLGDGWSLAHSEPVEDRDGYRDRFADLHVGHGLYRVEGVVADLIRKGVRENADTPRGVRTHRHRRDTVKQQHWSGSAGAREGLRVADAQAAAADSSGEDASVIGGELLAQRFRRDRGEFESELRRGFQRAGVDAGVAMRAVRKLQARLRGGGGPRRADTAVGYVLRIAQSESDQDAGVGDRADGLVAGLAQVLHLSSGAVAE